MLLSYPVNAGNVQLRIEDQATHQPVACRVHLKDSQGKPQRAGSLPFWHDHFVCPGGAELELPPGEYSYEVERGPEYTAVAGRFLVREDAPTRVELELKRLVELARDGWWSGELHVHRPIDEIPLLMEAEDLHVAPVITWWNNRNLWSGKPLPATLLHGLAGDRYYHVMGGEDEREGGALLFFNLAEPLPITAAGREYPSPMKFLAMARQRPSVWVDIEKPFWWDVPVWLASGQVDSIGLANNHMCRSQMFENEAWGKPRDERRLAAPLGNGFWTQEIYYHILNAGLHIPPSAGSASGVLPNPVGYNRVYVHLDGELSYEKWWDGLRAGRSFVTNGPLLRVRANGELPGHVFAAPAGNEVVLDIRAALAGRDPVRALEIILNGRVERSVPYDEWLRTGSLGKLRFRESGWMLVRAIADNPKTFRFAATAPFYVEIGDVRQRISRSSVRFFLDWIAQRMDRVQLDDPVQKDEVLAYHTAARRFWEERLAKANAD